MRYEKNIFFLAGSDSVLDSSDEFINSLCKLVINTNESLNSHKDYFYPENKCPTKFNKCPCSARI